MIGPARNRTKRMSMLRLCMACALGMLAAGMMIGVQHQGISWAETSERPPAAVASAQDLSVAFRHASQSVLPSVVTIRTSSPGEQTEVSHDGRSQFPEGFENLPREFQPFLKRFFEDDFSRIPQPESRIPRDERMGSGVVIDPSGIILTNSHVVDGAGRVLVQLQDNREFEAVEVQTDPKTDIAVIRIEGAGDLPAAVVGDSSELEIGDWVLAVGSPFGLSETVTAGIISAKSRGLGITDREEFLQTDAAINPGNSGGPLVNLRGEVVGINTAISTRGGGNDGVGFAVPINLARWVADQLVENGNVQRAFLGVGIQPVTGDLARQFGLDEVSGALITEVRGGSAAEAAGLQLGDTIVEFNGVAIDGPRKLQGVVERADTEGQHDLVVIRNGERLQFQLSLQPMPASLAATTPDDTPPEPDNPIDSLGMQVATLTEATAGQAGIDFESGGVLITGIDVGGGADRAGLRAGMVIRQVDRTFVSDVIGFQTTIQESDKTDEVLLLVSTATGNRFVVLDLG